MSIQNGCVLTHEGIEYLCGLIRDINGLDTNLIDDLNIKSNGTFSSLRINTLLNALKTDCNDFANSLVSNLSRLELRVVTDESDMIEHNKLYLIKKAGETSYSQYVIVTNDSGVDEKVLLGTTDINMSDYYTITQADNKFVLKTDFDALKTEVDKVKTDIGTEDISLVGTSVKDAIITLNTNKEEKSNKVTTLDSTSTDTQYPSALAVKTELDKKVDKTSITTTIDGTSTNDTIPTSKAVNELNLRGTLINQSVIDKYGTEIIKYPLGRWYFASSSIARQFSDIPWKEACIIDITSISNSGSPWDNIWSYRNYKAQTIAKRGYFIRQLESRDTVGTLYDTGWQRVCTTSVNDISLKRLTNSSDINSDADITYIVKNGMCSVSVNTVSSTKMSTGNITLTTGLPIPANTSCWYSLCTNSNATNAPLQNLLLRIDSSGNLIAYKGTDNINYFGSFSYPVAES